MIRITRETTITESARVLQARGMFEVQPSPTSREEWTVDADLTARPWSIGLIVGPSGSGKSTIARELFGAALVEGHEWDGARSILDGFPASMGIKAVIETLSSVGFSSPPAWLRPFHVLSTGQQFRVTVARALAEAQGVTVIDEFTSVVDRTVAQIGAGAVARTVRRQGRQFVAVACHYDILDWLQPDWVIDLGQPDADRPGHFALQWRSVQPRPQLRLTVHRGDKRAWPVFRPHHYMSGELHKGSQVSVAWLGDRPVSFCAVLWNPGHVSFWRVHRVVVLPDFQGAGVALRHLEFVAEQFLHRPTNPGCLHITTSHPGLMAAMARSPRWHLKGQPGRKRGKAVGSGLDGGVRKAVNKLMASFEYRPRGTQDAR